MEVMLLDHEGLMHTTLEFKMQKAGMTPIYVTNASEARDILNKNDISIAILDLDFGEKDVEMIIKECANTSQGNVPVIGITSLEDEDTILHWLQMGVADFIAKPYKTSEIIIRIKKAFAAAEAKHST